MKRSSATNTSRHLAYLLRHEPSFVNEFGWATISAAESALSAHAGGTVTRGDIKKIVAEDSKGRYEIQGERIRAVQGHSHPVNLGWVSTTPPETLLHGTVEKFAGAILREGLKPQSRTHVHMSETVETAVQVGSRRGEAVILTINAAQAAAEGVAFFQSANGVWLAQHVPAKFISR